ncbi:hypothetical protein [Caballeronia terrestris]|uniref:hypothetical protein n=1 Tax=Caballeronia terrestris TaxID=1226301 RepID=UPI0035B5208C
MSWAVVVSLHCAFSLNLRGEGRHGCADAQSDGPIVKYDVDAQIGVLIQERLEGWQDMQPGERDLLGEGVDVALRMGTLDVLHEAKRPLRR